MGSSLDFECCFVSCFETIEEQAEGHQGLQEGFAISCKLFATSECLVNLTAING